MELNFSKGDLLANLPINPGWYKGKIRKEELKSLTRDNVQVIDYIITLDFEKPELAADERTVEHTFFSCIGKGKGFMIVLMAAILNKNVKEVADGLEKGQTFGFQFGEGQNVGKQIQFLLKNEQYQGRILNKIETFIPYSAEPPLG